MHAERIIQNSALAPAAANSNYENQIVDMDQSQFPSFVFLHQKPGEAPIVLDGVGDVTPTTSNGTQPHQRRRGCNARTVSVDERINTADALPHDTYQWYKKGNRRR